MVECQLPKLDVAGSTPVARSIGPLYFRTVSRKPRKSRRSRQFAITHSVTRRIAGGEAAQTRSGSVSVSYGYGTFA